MATLRDGMPNWFDLVDFRQEILHGHDTDSSVPLFVDVGGAMGQQSIFFKIAYPDLQGRVIVQDQAQVVSQIEATPLPGFEGIEAMAHDFFKPQPIKGTCFANLSVLIFQLLLKVKQEHGRTISERFSMTGPITRLLRFSDILKMPWLRALTF